MTQKLRFALSWLWGLPPDFEWRDLFRSSWVTWAIFLVTVALSTFDMLLPPSSSGVDRLTDVLGWAPAKVADGEWWRLLTSTLTNSRVTEGFLGSPLGHLVENMLGLVLVGPRLERAIGHRRFLLLYVVAALAANAVAMVTLPLYWIPGGGSSRSVYALFGGILVIAFLARRSSTRHRVYFVFAALAILVLPGIVVTVGAIVEDVPENHVTHGTAFVVGLVLLAAWLRNARRIGIALVAGLLATSIGLVGVRAATIPQADRNVIRLIETPATPTLLTTAFGSIWATSLEDGTVTRIDPRGGRIVKTFRVSDEPGTLTATDRYIWVTASHRGLFAIDPATNRVVVRVRLPDIIWGVAATPGALWIALPRLNAVSRIDEATRKEVKLIRVADEPVMLAARGSSVWVASVESTTVTRIDARSNTVAATARVGPHAPYNMELDAKSLWVVVGKRIVRLNAQSLKVLSSTPSKDWVFDAVRTPNGPLWATHQYAYGLSRIDPGSVRLSRGIRLGFGRSYGIVRDDRGHLWLADGLRHGVLEIDPSR